MHPHSSIDDSLGGFAEYAVARCSSPIRPMTFVGCIGYGGDVLVTAFARGDPIE
jgi:hypothetical protein